MSIDPVISPAALLPTRKERGGALAVDDGKIVAVGAAGEVPEARPAIEATCLVVMPGAIVPHVPGAYHPLGHDIPAQTRAAAAGGVTTIIGILEATRMGQALRLCQLLGRQ